MEQKLSVHKKNFREQIHLFLENSTQEIVETKEAGSIIWKHMQGSVLTKEEKAFIRTQTYDVLKSIGIIVPFAFIPGASILIAAIVTVANKKGINILPSSFATPKVETNLSEKPFNKENISNELKNDGNN